MDKTYTSLMAELQSFANPRNVAGMARFGISSTGTLGVSIVNVRKLARGVKDHALAEQLWASGVHEARILACLVDRPQWVIEEQMEHWVAAFESWDVCDQVCLNLFRGTPYAYAKVYAWTARPEEFVKRAGFVLIATLAVHDKQAPDQAFLDFLPLIEREAGDGRNFVKKAVNWALRQIGKRNPALREAALACAQRIQAMDSTSARWIARDAIKELSPQSPRTCPHRRCGERAEKREWRVDGRETRIEIRES